MRNPDGARVLVVSDSAIDAGQITGLLHGDFRDARALTCGERGIAEVESFRPDVIVFGFDSLEKNQAFARTLYRSSAAVRRYDHRRVLLCQRDEVRGAFELCKAGAFDDYVLYWPHVHDGLRLVMSVWGAARQLIGEAMSAPAPLEVAEHLGHVTQVEALVEEHAHDGRRRARRARSSLQETERAVGDAIDALSEHLRSPRAAALIEVKDPSQLADEFDRLKKGAVSEAFRQRAAVLAPKVGWAERLADKLAPHLHGLRRIGKKMVKTRPVVLVVEDDEFGRQMTEIALDGQRYDLTFAHTGVAALALLRHMQPDVILMDVNLPDLDGVTLTQRLKAMPTTADIPVLMVTGEARRETIKNSMRAGAADFVVKPFTREGLLSKLERVLTGAP